MLFNSLYFFLFFTVVVTLYYLCLPRWRLMLLLAASYYFYMFWGIEYAGLLAVSTIITFVTGIKMGSIHQRAGRRRYLIVSIVLNIGILFTFKYFNFANNSLQSLFDYFNISYGVPELMILVPVGISFYTFKVISYSVDVFRGNIKSEKNFIRYALYVSFFPQLLAGPIERSTHLLPQFYKKLEINYYRVTDGMRLMAWGLFKKVVIADRLACVVDRVYNDPYNYSGVPLIVATYCFTYQIYCDFSGYSDMAIGAAKILGFESKPNFNLPYFSRTLSEFWRRWHISLTSWFRDYLYIPLGGNRVARWNWYMNLLIVFLISGLWHGANWTFIVWGLLHGAYLLFGILTKKVRNKFTAVTARLGFSFLHRLIQIATTFVLVSYAWLFFRANNLEDAVYISTHMFSDIDHFVNHFTEPDYLSSIIRQIGLSSQELVIIISAIGILELVQLILYYPNAKSRFASQPVWLRWIAYYALTIMIIFFGAFNTAQDFIYLRF